MIKNIIKKIFSDTYLYGLVTWIIGSYERSKLNEDTHRNIRFMGEGSTIANDVTINRPDRVIIKEHSNIAQGALINSLGGLYVGSYSGIGYNCVIWTAEHHYRKSKSIPFDNKNDLKPVIIRDFVWIGSNVKILPGKEIGEGAIIGMGSVITKDVPPLAIVIGNPAEVVGYRDEAHFNECKKSESFRPHKVSIKQDEEVYPYYRRKFKKELIELGLLSLE